MLRNAETRICCRRILSQVDVIARLTSLKLLLNHPSTLLLLLQLRKQMRLLMLPHNLGSSLILLAFIGIIYLFHHVTGRNSSAMHTERNLKLLVRLDLANAERRAPLLSQISRPNTSKMLQRTSRLGRPPGLATHFCQAPTKTIPS
jgi:hypothetical protein